jgi:hypothetical protein
MSARVGSPASEDPLKKKNCDKKTEYYSSKVTFELQYSVTFELQYSVTLSQFFFRKSGSGVLRTRELERGVGV